MQIPVRPVAAIDAQRISRFGVGSGRDLLAHQIPNPGFLKVPAHRGQQGRSSPAPLASLTSGAVDIQPYQVFPAGEERLCQVRFALRDLQTIRQRFFQHRSDGPRMIGRLRLEPLGDFDLQRFQHLRVGVRIEAAHPAPVAGKAHHALPAFRGAQQHANIDELVSYRIRHVTDELKFTPPPLRHPALLPAKP